MPASWRSLPTEAGHFRDNAGIFEIHEKVPAKSSKTYYAGLNALDGPNTISRSEIFWNEGDDVQYAYTAAGSSMTVSMSCQSTKASSLDTVIGQPPDYKNVDLGTVTVTIWCFTNPEKITIHNDSTTPLIFDSIASYVRGTPKRSDTLTRNDLLTPGGSIA